MAEDRVRTVVLAALRPLHAVHVENVMLAGMPDINYVDGWLELKWLKSWPRRPETVVAVPEFKPEQRVFLFNRCRAGGQARVLLRVGKSWLLLPGQWSAIYLGRSAVKVQIEEAAEKYWRNQLAGHELLAYLAARPKSILLPKSSLLANAIA